MALVAVGCGSASSLIGYWGNADESGSNADADDGTSAQPDASVVAEPDAATSATQDAAPTGPVRDASTNAEAGRQGGAEMPADVAPEPILDCETGYVSCDGQCIVAASDRRYCGARGDCRGDNAGTVCGGSSECVEGLCRCPEGMLACHNECIETELLPCGVVPSCDFGLVTEFGDTRTLGISATYGRRVAGNVLGEFWVGWQGADNLVCVAHRAAEEEIYAEPQPLGPSPVKGALLYEIDTNSVGGALAVWKGQGELYANFFDSTLARFGSPTLIDGGENEAYVMSGALEDSGRALVVWAKRDDSVEPALGTLNLSVFEPDAGAWNNPVLIAEGEQGTLSFWADVGIDDSQTALLLWQQQPGPSILSRTYSLTTGELGETTQLLSAGALPRLAVNEAGSAVAAWTASGNVTVAHSGSVLGQWDIPFALDENGRTDGAPILGMDAEGNAHLALGGIIVVDYTASSGRWSELQQLETEDDGGTTIPSLAVDSLGGAAAAFYRGSALYIARFDKEQQTWSTDRIFREPIQIGNAHHYPQIAVAEAGHYAIAFDTVTRLTSGNPLPNNWVTVTHVR